MESLLFSHQAGERSFPALEPQRLPFPILAGTPRNTQCAASRANALDHEANISKVQKWLEYANIATTRLYNRRCIRSKDSPTFKVAYRCF